MSLSFKKYITHSGSKWTVHSESGKSLGEYGSEAEAKHRLQQIEYFKHVTKSVDDLRAMFFNLGKSGEVAKQEMAVEGLSLVREDLGVRHKPAPNKKLP